MNHEALFGVWALQSANFEFQDGGGAIDIYGPGPTGRAIFAPEFRMIVLITANGRKSPETPEETAAAFGSMLAYSGVFRFSEPGTIVTDVDISWFPAWVGTQQVRHVDVEGDHLTIRSDPQAHPAFDQRVGVAWLRWTRDASTAPD